MFSKYLFVTHARTCTKNTVINKNETIKHLITTK